MADQVALHSDYLGIIRLMTKGKEVTFPKQEGYKGMVSVLQGDGPLSYYTIAKEFKPFMEGEDNLNLILLTVADYTENGVPSFKVATFDKDFEARSKDIQWRYHGKAVEEGRTPSLLGQALVDGGMNRIERYKDLISTLLQNNPADVEQLRARTTFFYE